MNEELKDILAGAGIKGSEPVWERPTHINELVDAANRSLEKLSTEDDSVAIILLVGKRVPGGMIRGLTAGGGARNILHLLEFSGEDIRRKCLTELLSAAPDETK